MVFESDLLEAPGKIASDCVGHRTRSLSEGVLGVAPLRPENPMVGSLLAFCPRATTGHAVAAPISVMNSRRLTAFPQGPDRLLAHDDRLVGRIRVCSQK